MSVFSWITTFVCGAGIGVAFRDAWSDHQQRLQWRRHEILRKELGEARALAQSYREENERLLAAAQHPEKSVQFEKTWN